MGTDIHCWAEVRRGAWEKVGKRWPRYYEEGGLTDEPYDARCYDAFAVLADVRNGSGFAGVKTGDGFIPVSGPRGLPADVTEGVRAECGWGHDHSWLSLRDLLEYPHWGCTTHRQGLVDAENYLLWKREGAPESWWGGGGHEVGHAAMEAAIERGQASGICTSVRWPVTYKDAARGLTDELIPRLVALAGDEPHLKDWASQAVDGDRTALNPLHDWLEEHGRPGLDDIRIVFFFDS